MTADNPEIPEVVETIAEVAADVVEEANERAEIAEETNAALAAAALEDNRVRQVQTLEERILSCETKIETTNQAMEAKLSEMATMQRETLDRLSSIPQNLNPPSTVETPVKVEVTEEPESLEVAPVKTESLPEVQAEPLQAVIVEPKPETKGVPGKRKIRLL